MSLLDSGFDRGGRTAGERAGGPAGAGRPDPAGTDLRRARRRDDPAAAAAGDVVPISRRVAALAALRVLSTATVVVLTGTSPISDIGLVAVGLMSAATLLGVIAVGTRHDGLRVALFGLMLCLDAVAVQIGQSLLGTGRAGDLLLAVFTVTVCLLGSFRTGIKLAFWQTLVLLVADSGRRTGLLPAAADGEGSVGARVVLVWLLVLVTCYAAALSERELRRRRYDAEAVQRFAAALHGDTTPEEVQRRTLDFVVAELDAGRVAVLAGAPERLQVVAGRGLAVAPDHVSPASALVAATARSGESARLLALDPERDPWLDSLMPAARRLLVLQLVAPGGEQQATWIVLEHTGRGIRVERRVVVTAAQASSTAGLALQRSVLYQRSLATAFTDGLTGVPNRRAFDTLMARLAAGDQGYAVALADVDHFKSVNDTHGHQVGDEVLKAVAATLREAAPEGATVARYGGEEFVVVIPGAARGRALAVGEQLRRAIEASTDPLPVTASFGVAVAAPGHDPAAVLAEADAALYRAKRGGRNQVVAAGAVPGPRPSTEPPGTEPPGTEPPGTEPPGTEPPGH